MLRKPLICLLFHAWVQVAHSSSPHGYRSYKRCRRCGAKKETFTISLSRARPTFPNDYKTIRDVPYFAPDLKAR